MEAKAYKRQVVSNLGSRGMDNLIAHATEPLNTMAVTVKAEEAGTVARGTILLTEDGKTWSVADLADYSGKYAPCILCDDVEITEADVENGVPAAAYRTGCFNIDALTAKSEITDEAVTAKVKDDLRQYGIFLVHMKQ